MLARASASSIALNGQKRKTHIKHKRQLHNTINDSLLCCSYKSHSHTFTVTFVRSLRVHWLLSLNQIAILFQQSDLLICALHKLHTFTLYVLEFLSYTHTIYNVSFLTWMCLRLGSIVLCAESTEIDEVLFGFVYSVFICLKEFNACLQKRIQK